MVVNFPSKFYKYTYYTQNTQWNCRSIATFFFYASRFFFVWLPTKQHPSSALPAAFDPQNGNRKNAIHLHPRKKAPHCYRAHDGGYRES